jgi:hypothetical protein
VEINVLTGIKVLSEVNLVYWKVGSLRYAYSLRGLSGESAVCTRDIVAAQNSAVHASTYLEVPGRLYRQSVRKGIQTGKSTDSSTHVLEGRAELEILLVTDYKASYVALQAPENCSEKACHEKKSRGPILQPALQDVVAWGWPFS